MPGGPMQGAQVGCAVGGAGEVGEALGPRAAAQRGRRRSAGGEEDIFSAVGGLELDADLRAQGALPARHCQWSTFHVAEHLGGRCPCWTAGGRRQLRCRLARAALVVGLEQGQEVGVWCGNQPQFIHRLHMCEGNKAVCVVGQATNDACCVWATKVPYTIPICEC